jgi:hypothetical protein
MLDTVTKALVYGAYIVVVCFVGFVLWQTLFGPSALRNIQRRTALHTASSKVVTNNSPGLLLGQNLTAPPNKLLPITLAGSRLYGLARSRDGRPVRRW